MERLAKSVVLALAALALSFGGTGVAPPAGAAPFTGAAPPVSTPRHAFDIVTGSPAGSFFSAGEAIARVVSHPPGLPRCEKKDVCGPPGLIISVRSSDGAVANVLAVENGTAASGLAQAAIVTAAIDGRGAFRKSGRQSHIRVIADLFPEAVQLVAVPNLRKLGDLRGKRVSLGAEGSGGGVIAAAILAASGVKRLKLSRNSPDVSAELLQQGKLDAFFYIGSAASPLVTDLLARGKATLIPISGKLRSRLIARTPGLGIATIPSAQGPVETIGSHTWWIASSKAAPETVYGLLRALNHPANRALLPAELRLTAPPRLLPLHPGAARYFNRR
jgi:uncharacterized protein